MCLNYEKENTKAASRSVKSWQQKEIASAGKFPNCKGLYPECPNKPNINKKMCRSCPKIDE